MSWVGLVIVGAAGIGAMRAAIDRGDIDEAARQGERAGPVVVERALFARDRPARLAAIAAAPGTGDRAELLAPLARVAAGADRRTAIPAAHAARAIARELASSELPDDLAGEDVATWRAAWLDLAAHEPRWIELRVIALDVAVALDRVVPPASAPPIDLAPILAASDPAMRRAAIAVLPMPVPTALRPKLAAVVARDRDDGVALAAAATLCADLAVDPPAPILATLDDAARERIATLIADRAAPRELVRDAARCAKR